MLGEILKTLKSHQGEELRSVPNKIPNKVPNKIKTRHPEITEGAWNVYAVLLKDNTSSAEEIGKEIGMSDRMVRKHLAMLKESGLIVREGSNKTGWWQLINTKKD